MASIELRANRGVTTYRVVWRETGRKQSATWPTLAAAERFQAKVEAYGNRWPPGEAPAGVGSTHSPTFGEWAETAIARRSRASEGTKANYRRDLGNHFALLLDVPLADIDEGTVAAWIADRQAQRRMSPKTLRNLHGFASSLLGDALRQYPPLVSHNPFLRRLAEFAPVRTEEMVFLTPQEFATILRWVREEYRPLIRLLAGTGLRYGEATALTVGDVDLLGRRTLTVTKAWKRVDSSGYELGEPKTRQSRRTLSLSAELVDLLVPLTAGRRGDELLFTRGHNLRIPHSEVYKRGWAPAVARARVCDVHWEPQRDGRGNRPRLPAPCDCATVLTKKPRMHDLRHSQASWLIAEGLPLPAISRRLGHSSISITVDRYGHLDPAMDERINAAVDRALLPQH